MPCRNTSSSVRGQTTTHPLRRPRASRCSRLSISTSKGARRLQTGRKSWFTAGVFLPHTWAPLYEWDTHSECIDALPCVTMFKQAAVSTSFPPCVCHEKPQCHVSDSLHFFTIAPCLIFFTFVHALELLSNTSDIAHMCESSPHLRTNTPAAAVCVCVCVCVCVLYG